MLRKSLTALALAGGLVLPSVLLAEDKIDTSTSTRRPGFTSMVLTGRLDEKYESADARAEQEPTQNLSPEMAALSDRINRTLTHYYERPENVANRSVWGIMHALIAYGVDTEVIAGDRKVNAIGYVCYNGPCKGQRLFYLDKGQMAARQGPGVQGHPGQFLAMLAQSRVKKDFPIRIEGKNFTVEDLIEYEMRTCRSKTELTFKLIGLAHYLPSDTTWKNDLGETWSIPKLIQEELAQPIVGAACGGTHRLTGFSYAVNKRAARGEVFDGQWQRAQVYEDSFHDYLMKLRNRDGSFSTEWFAGRGDEPDVNKRVQTTGHMTEWMVYSLPKDQLTDVRVVETVNYLNELLWRSRNTDLEIGPRGHALHALVIYQERMFNAAPGHRTVKLAKEPRASK